MYIHSNNIILLVRKYTHALQAEFNQLQNGSLKITVYKSRSTTAKVSSDMSQFSGLPLRILVAGERCNITGEYSERGSSSE